MIWVKITARHRWVLMAGHALEKGALDTSVGHQDQRRVSQAVPHEAGQPKIVNQLVPARRIAQGRSRDHPSGPTSRRASVALPTVSRSSVARSGSMIGTERPGGLLSPASGPGVER